MKPCLGLQHVTHGAGVLLHGEPGGDADAVDGLGLLDHDEELVRGVAATRHRPGRQGLI